ncbi:hypothetical protein AVEN_38165-1 [Araneus ventricosus]|uniref:Ig-like domain-containing protein n=1 Tax=Araneus ventricosus TaxID=182803 RepID=A0A4Y2F191_ARAVE|nr:hypothetical protein AVEN_38165-1 [Araneus ventricosus]
MYADVALWLRHLPLKTRLLIGSRARIPDKSLKFRHIPHRMMRPTDVRITSPYQPLSAGKETDIVCVARGARPPAQISWWLDGEKLTTKITESTAEEDNLTISSLNIRPSIQDNLRNLSCRGDNPQLTDSVLEDTWLISVHYLPRLTVKMNMLDAVKEGSEVNMTCLVHSLPPVTELEWLQDGRPLGPPVGANFLNRTLLIPSAGPQHKGEYQCAGTNSEGRAVSDPILLQVLYAPRCESVRSSVYGVGRTESVSVTCEVDAYPNVVNFTWVLVNVDKHSSLPTAQFYSNGTKSVATVSPRAPQDYGVLQCWATNVIGQQKDPCSFRIIPAVNNDDNIAEIPGYFRKLEMITFHNLTKEAVEVVYEMGEAYSTGRFSNRWPFVVYFSVELRSSRWGPRKGLIHSSKLHKKCCIGDPL